MQDGNIEFKNVSFSYDGKRRILDNISFKVNQGETIAFVGSTDQESHQLLMSL